MNSIFYKKYIKYKKKYLQKLAQNRSNNFIQKGGLIRHEIMSSYVNDLSSFMENKEENLALLLQSYNKPYTQFTIGMWYAIDYSRLINKNDDNRSFFGLSNKYYWDIGVARENGTSLLSYFQSFDYIKVYMLIGIITGSIILFRGTIIALFAKKNSNKLFDKLIFSIMRSPLCIY